MKRLVWAAGLSLALIACKGNSVDGASPSAHAEPQASSTAGSDRGPQKIEIVQAPDEGPIQVAVEAELARARHQNRQLLVYVGAHWCEPCNRFLAAARAGQLDTVFPRLTLFVYDLDHDKQRLVDAGYVSQMIPLFAAPKKDGTASGFQIEGSIKGEGAVDQIRPRLEALLVQAAQVP